MPLCNFVCDTLTRWQMGRYDKRKQPADIDVVVHNMSDEKRSPKANPETKSRSQSPFSTGDNNTTAGPAVTVASAADGSGARAPPMVVVFGRPGAGKTTIADGMITLERGRLLGLDLDACVPQWMRDNFAKGVYPTLEQRAGFAAAACDYVDQQVNTFLAAEGGEGGVIVSFSFVNDDLRDAFRARFPQAVWCLVDTAPATASERVARREGHFYKEPDSKGDPEWEFAVVKFPHEVLDGEAPVEDNAHAALAILREGGAPDTTANSGTVRSRHAPCCHYVLLHGAVLHAFIFAALKPRRSIFQELLQHTA